MNVLRKEMLALLLYPEDHLEDCFEGRTPEEMNEKYQEEYEILNQLLEVTEIRRFFPIFNGTVWKIIWDDFEASGDELDEFSEIEEWFEKKVVNAIVDWNQETTGESEEQFQSRLTNDVLKASTMKLSNS